MRDLVAEFADNVVAQYEATHRGDAVTGNEHAKRYISAFKELRSLGDAGRDQLLPLLFDKRSRVRVAAAAFLLRYRNAEATAVLQKEAKGRGIVAFEAGQALERWKDGTWALDIVHLDRDDNK
jgi:hypothetical protein